MVLESQSLWKMGLARRGNEKSLVPFGGGRGEERGLSWVRAAGRWTRSLHGVVRSPSFWPQSLQAGSGAAVAWTLCVPQIRGLNFVPRVWYLGGGPLEVNRSWGWNPVGFVIL